MVALTSQAMAVARGSADATGQMVICIGAETVTVYTDADGAPTQAPHLCPDCVIHMIADVAAPRVLVPSRIVNLDAVTLLTALQVLGPHRRIPEPRAPPYPV